MIRVIIVTLMAVGIAEIFAAIRAMAVPITVKRLKTAHRMVLVPIRPEMKTRRINNVSKDKHSRI